MHSLRLQRRLTLERLASNAGLSKGFLSEIEHGLALPSLTTLVRLAGQLTLPLHELLRLPPPARKRAAAAAPANGRNGRNGRKAVAPARRGSGGRSSTTARA